MQFSTTPFTTSALRSFTGLACKQKALQKRFGDKYLVYSTYPSGFPLYNIDESTAEKVLHSANPGVSIDRSRYLYGRTEVDGQTVGAIIYPLHQKDRESVMGVLSDPNYTEEQKDSKINEMMPNLMKKEKGPTRIYDLSQEQLVLNASAETNAAADKGEASAADKPAGDKNAQPALAQQTHSATASAIPVPGQTASLTQPVLLPVFNPVYGYYATYSVAPAYGWLA